MLKQQLSLALLFRVLLIISSNVLIIDRIALQWFLKRAERVENCISWAGWDGLKARVVASGGLRLATKILQFLGWLLPPESTPLFVDQGQIVPGPSQSVSPVDTAARRGVGTQMNFSLSFPRRSLIHSLKSWARTNILALTQSARTNGERGGRTSSSRRGWLSHQYRFHRKL